MLTVLKAHLDFNELHERDLSGFSKAIVASQKAY